MKTRGKFADSVLPLLFFSRLLFKRKVEAESHEATEFQWPLEHAAT